MADRIHQTWVDFATDGTLPWPEFDTNSRNVHLLGSDETIQEPPMLAASLIP